MCNCRNNNEDTIEPLANIENLETEQLGHCGHQHHHHGEFRNRAEIEFGCGGRPVQILSNEVVARRISIRVEKHEDRTCVTTGDIIGYTIDVHNDGHHDVENLTFTDRLPRGLEFVERSLCVNGRHTHRDRNAGAGTVRCRIERIPRRGRVQVTFSARVV